MSTPSLGVAAPFKIALTANFAGRVCVGVLSIVATPLYLRWLGVEGYGLVGFFLLLQAVSGFASSVISDAVNREVAAPYDAGERAAVVVGFRRAAWVLGLVIGVACLLGSGSLVAHWLTIETLGMTTAVRAVRWMAVALALQVPLDFYVGCLLGLHRHVAANLMLAGTAGLRLVAGIAAVVAWHSVESFFIAQAAASLAMVIAGEWVVRSAADGAAPTSRPLAVLRRSLRFSTGLTVIAATGMVLSQADRLILSRALTLADFGLYTVATTLANLLYYWIGPVRSTYYAEFAHCTTDATRGRLAELYHSACTRMAVLVMPTAAILLLFARDLVYAWTGSEDLATRAEPIVMFLVAARLISAVNSLPYTVQFAHGWTGLIARANMAAIVVLLPVLAWLAMSWGAVGAAAGYFVLSLPFVVVIVWRMHRRILVGELARWALHDTLPSLVLAFAVAGVWRWIEPTWTGRWTRLAWVATGGLVTLAIVAAAAGGLGRSLVRRLRRPAVA